MDTNNGQENGILVLYGSETGTAQDLAESLWRELTRNGYDVAVECLDDLDLKRIISRVLCIFICSTTGQGEVPRNMKTFWRFLLRKRLPSDFLDCMQYAVFGCGDSSYARFNWTAKKLDRRLQQLGANRICLRGEGDEQHELGVPGLFAYWLTHLNAAIARYRTPNRPALTKDALLEPVFDIRFLSPSVDESDLADLSLTKDHLSPSTFKCTERVNYAIVEENNRMTAPDHWQDVRHVKLRLPASVSWSAGDIAVLYPCNDDTSVIWFLKRMGWYKFAAEPITVQTKPNGKPLGWLPSPLTPYTLVKYMLSLHSMPSRAFFEYAAHFADNDLHRERLAEFADNAHIEEYYNYVTRPRRTLIETLQEFDSLRVPFHYALDVFPLMKGRQYSIASACHPEDNTLELAIALVRFKTRMHGDREGVCSRWLKDVKPGTELSIDILKAASKLDINSPSPFVMIGPGTGVAPMRLLVQHRVSNGLTNNVLVFGCRNKEKDFLFQKEWEAYSAQKQLELYCAFSRDQDKKHYVQNVIREHGERFFDLIYNQKAIVCVCGSSGKMPTAVREAIATIVSKYLDGKYSTGNDYLLTMEKEKRFYQETW
ncbi:NADPH-dependent diflavin oxidoreductase [Schizosaccharomyces japonicus yFS275]|uniref:NADPH-dependent diflavin oxidoreductase 1 n=1 Tax=Schizosaccharomyces japonicus (strain yFS275 / FY16936) TaxID=402676 RepID=B6JX45_SCHJY|nr:NADPH-dependent diflavin oxidoreductase [Schizosaccharomyces japonicus yFS275]EEB05946.2 NADPH-dependent diflavin oxidoreductase [Schizosaccharomyces japonicus yFS275]